MFKTMRIVAALVLMTAVVSAQAAERPNAVIDGLALSAIERDRTGDANDIRTTHILKGLFDDWSPEFNGDLDTPLIDDDPPLNRPLPESAKRFGDNTRTEEGWTSTLGLLPQPQSKLALPSPDVRLQERGIHVGGIYRF